MVGQYGMYQIFVMQQVVGKNVGDVYENDCQYCCGQVFMQFFDKVIVDVVVNCLVGQIGQDVEFEQ